MKGPRLAAMKAACHNLRPLVFSDESPFEKFYSFTFDYEIRTGEQFTDDQTYKQAIDVIQADKPTNFGPIFNHVSQFLQENEDSVNDLTVVLLTDGVTKPFGNTL